MSEAFKETLTFFESMDNQKKIAQEKNLLSQIHGDIIFDCRESETSCRVLQDDGTQIVLSIDGFAYEISVRRVKGSDYEEL